jgi:hypothetical protein
LRQLYYQLVSRNVLPNVGRSYKNLSALISDVRLAGLIDWDVIEDRLRRPVLPTEFTDLQELVAAALASYRLPRWRGQAEWPELWVEKDALAGVLAPIAGEFHVAFQVCRGYSSQSAMYESTQRLFPAIEAGKSVRILYLGDHDPSGLDMVRDIRDRLKRFHCDAEVTKLALIREQVEQYQLPPQPGKATDARFTAYAAEHGEDVWELDALPPDVLAGLVRGALTNLVDPHTLRAVLRQEARDKVQLRKAVASLNHRRGT